LERGTSILNDIFAKHFLEKQKKDKKSLTVDEYVNDQMSKSSSLPSFVSRLQRALEQEMEPTKKT
jgi:hypothetical protein